MAETFSVIVPIYKVQKYLNKCVDSILNQTFRDFELILVEDGSPDKCPQICDQYAEQDNRVKVIHKQNGGLVSARNAGIKAAKGDYICYVDGDDWIDGRLLETVFQEAIQPYRPDMVIFGIVKKYLDKDIEILNDLQDGLYEKEQLNECVYPYMIYDCRKAFCKGLIFPAACNKIYSRRLLLEHYCRDERIRMGEDNAFVYECVFCSNRIYICNKVLYYYNQLNPNAMSYSYDSQRFENNRLLFDYMEQRFRNRDSVLDVQLNAFKTYWLIMAIFHEVKSGNRISAAAKHIRIKIKQMKVLDDIKVSGLPKYAVLFVLMLRVHMYRFVLFGAYMVQKGREHVAGKITCRDTGQ